MKKTGKRSFERTLSFTDQEKSLGALLRRPYLLLAKRVYGHLAAHGYPEVRPAHGAVFRHIPPDGARITELAEQAQITKQSMGSLVEHLKIYGYVELHPDPDDGRAKIVCLTERGRAFQRDAVAVSRRVEDEVAQQLGAEVQQMRVLLEHLADAMEQLKT